MDPVKRMPPPAAPMDVGRRIVSERFVDPDGTLLIRRWRGGFHTWDGRCWPESEPDTIRSGVYLDLESAVYEVEIRGSIVERPWHPTRSKVGNVLEAMGAIVQLPSTFEPPAWLDAADRPDPRDLLITANGILHLPDRVLLPHDPRLFVTHALPYPYDPHAERPVRWLTFLSDLWGDDVDSIALLQEVFGYAVSGDTSLQKIPLVVGPTRAGKGVIARVLTSLLGRDAIGAPTLAGLTSHFGLQDLIGKTLAIVSDARLGPRTDVQVLAERLLSISGEDSITIDRKHRDPWTGRLGVRVMVFTNELPRFNDVSGALAKRFLVLVLSKSFYGREDPRLLDSLLPELPGILNWALDGLDRLRAQGYFTTPASAGDVVRAFEDLASPTGAFVRERCRVEPNARVRFEDLWAAWNAWAEHQSLPAGSRQSFGRDLRAAVPGLRSPRLREGVERSRAYEGITLVDELSREAEVRGPDGPSGSDDRRRG